MQLFISLALPCEKIKVGIAEVEGGYSYWLIFIGCNLKISLVLIFVFKETTI